MTHSNGLNDKKEIRYTHVIITGAGFALKENALFKL